MAARGDTGREIVVDRDHAGSRVDVLLAALSPSLGVRARRRLVEAGLVLLNGRRARSGDRAGEGARLVLLDDGLRCAQGPRGRLILERPRYLFFAKPALVHTVSLAGKGGASLEEQVPAILAAAGLPYGGVTLLQRLDFATSGIVAAARSQAAARAFREAEARGIVAKRYVCLLEGVLESPARVSRQLVSDGGRGVRCLQRDDPDPARTTAFTPLGTFPLGELFPGHARAGELVTLAGCVIQRGARHQVRAHARSLGHPLAGDRRYGAALTLPWARGFFLHHGLLTFPGERAGLLPDDGDLPLSRDAPAGARARALVSGWFAQER